MKDGDWNFKGKSVPLLAHVFDASKKHGVDMHISATSHSEAIRKVEQKLKCRKDFLRVTGGKYDVRFERELAI